MIAPSTTVKDAGGPPIFHPVSSVPLNRLVNPGSTAGAFPRGGRFPLERCRQGEEKDE